MSTTEDDRLFGEAVNLALRLQTSGESELAREALCAWRQRSAQHEKVWAELTEIQQMTGVLMAADPSGTATPRLSRRRTLGLIAGTLGAGGAAFVLGPEVISAARADILTPAGRVVGRRLDDGSNLVIGPDSAVALQPGPAHRGLRLLRGLIWCEVATMRSEPFRFRFGRQDIVCESGRLNASLAGRQLDLTLESGRAWLTENSATEIALQPGRRFIIGPDGIETNTHRAPGEAGAWREGLLLADAEPVASLVGQIARWIPGRVVLTSRALGRRLVSGTFDLHDPYDALAAVIHPHGGRLHRAGPVTFILG